MKVISFFNLKGGCGKTTSAINLGYLLAKDLAEKNQKLLLVDCDMQANLTTSLMEPDYDRPCIYHLMTGDRPLADTLFHLRDNVDIIPSSLLMATIDPRPSGMVGREFILKRRLKEIADDYAYCIIDCSPSFSVVTTNALVMTDKIFIPVQTEYYAVDGVHLLQETLQYVNDSLGVEKEISIIFATMHDKRNNINQLQYENLEHAFGDKFMRHTIRKNVALVESPVFKQSIFEYKPKANGAQDYQALYDEIKAKGGF